ncbi:MAG: VIT domain-containing protein [Candidatus Parcubacteria bacterium]|nr:VIT domain-containing protein [Candidatus Parcubacteria bacterium]
MNKDYHGKEAKMSNKKREAEKLLNLLKTRARPALNFPELVGIVRHSSTPNEAFKKANAELCYELAYLAAGDRVEALKQVKVLQNAVHQLAKIKRDFGKAEFGKFVADNSGSTADSTSPRLLKHASTGQSNPSKLEGKGEVTMGKGKGTAAKEAQNEKQETQVQPSIPLKHIEYRVALNGAHARVRCIQVFTNDAMQSVEAVYAFPLPDEASVAACVMQIGKKKIQAELKEREQARREYDQAVNAGHHGALMEQERPNIFTMNVGGIEKGETIKVEITYVQRIPWQDGGGRFRVPLVVAPRFIPGVPTGKQGGGWASDTDEVPDASRITPNVAPEGVPYDANINVSFAPGFRCKLTCPSHDLLIKEQTVAKDDKIELKTGDIRTDRDFTLVYKSLSKRPEIAVFQNAGKDESFCLVNILPPGDMANVPSDMVFLLDVSGSMDGPKIEGLKEIVRKVVDKNEKDQLGHRVGVVIYSNDAQVLAAIGTDSEQLRTRINDIRAGGSTYLGRGLKAAYKLFQDSGRPRVIVLVSDGQTEDMTTLDPDIRIIAAGIDSAVNDSTLKDVAKQTKGTAVWFYPGEDFDRAANTMTNMISGPVLRDVKVEGQGEVAGLADVYVGQPATIALRFDGELPAEIKISGKDPSGQQEIWTIKPASGKDCDFAPQIWAREAIRETPDKTKQVQISLKYGVICAYTSFVAISVKEVPGQKPEKKEIPINLPMVWEYDKDSGRPQLSLQMKSYAFAPPPGPSRFIGASAFCSPSPPRGSSALDTFGLMGGDEPAEIDELCCFEDSGVESCDEVCEDFAVMPIGSPDIDDEASATVADRFTLDAADLVDRLIAILIEVAKGNRLVAEAYFPNLKLTVKEIQSWSESKRAMALYFAIRLRAFNLKLDQKLVDALAIPPKSSKEADCWQYLTAKEIGLVAKGIPQIPTNIDGSKYLYWKTNPTNPRPTDSWSLVP